MALSDVAICSRNGSIKIDIGIEKLHPPNGTHCVLYNNQKFFDSYVGPTPEKLSEIIIKRNGNSLFCEYKKQGLTCKRGSF